MKIGIVGAGQLARMLALAGYPLGLRCTVLDPAPDACAGQVAELLQGAYDDREKLTRLAEQVDLVTFDFENVPAATAGFLAERVPVFPPPTALETAQDRLSEKRLFLHLGIPTPAFQAIDSLDELRAAVAEIGLPAVLKTRRMGYDGKGQYVLRAEQDIDQAWETAQGSPLILEAFVPFESEVSILAVRDRQGRKAFYSLVQNHHRNGILRLSTAPCVAADLAKQAQDYATRILDRLEYVGVLAVEFFERDDQLLANEMAPRVHNSGHWTIEGAETSQFENHLRAILGLPLGSTAALGYTAMLNCIGDLADQTTVLAIPGAHFHAYGKTPQPGRKVGHITLRAADPLTLSRLLTPLLPAELVDVLE
ncbi:MAG: 5-(carboxyamino)imidazole ribonucleotide synthase [Candidatus Competibacteraceae bacterium]|nr:5-(carboxyamino)imidazole ribonucleotide synthase [Candidatus Competibacteraceae bacterium]